VVFGIVLRRWGEAVMPLTGFPRIRGRREKTLSGFILSYYSKAGALPGNRPKYLILGSNKQKDAV
jgi:hypothetical protein